MTWIMNDVKDAGDGASVIVSPDVKCKLSSNDDGENELWLELSRESKCKEMNCQQMSKQLSLLGN